MKCMLHVARDARLFRLLTENLILVLQLRNGCQTFQKQQVLLLFGGPFPQALLQACCYLSQCVAGCVRVHLCTGAVCSSMKVECSYQDLLWSGERLAIGTVTYVSQGFTCCRCRH